MAQSKASTFGTILAVIGAVILIVALQDQVWGLAMARDGVVTTGTVMRRYLTWPGKMRAPQHSLTVRYRSDEGRLRTLDASVRERDWHLHPPGSEIGVLYQRGDPTKAELTAYATFSASRPEVVLGILLLAGGGLILFASRRGRAAAPEGRG